MESTIKESVSTLKSPNVINSNHLKLKDLADTLNCDVNNLKLRVQISLKKR
jgi:hypothetical protein